MSVRLSTPKMVQTNANTHQRDPAKTVSTAFRPQLVPAKNFQPRDSIARRPDAADRIEQIIHAVKSTAGDEKAVPMQASECRPCIVTYKGVKLSAEVVSRQPVENAAKHVNQTAWVQSPGVCQAQGLISVSQVQVHWQKRELIEGIPVGLKLAD